MWYILVFQPSKCRNTHFQTQIWSTWPIFPNDSESLPQVCYIKQKNSEILSKLRNSESAGGSGLSDQPVAGGVANAKEYHLVLSSGNFYCFFSPWIPSYWIILMLSQIRRKLRSELVRFWSSSGSHCSTVAVQGFLLFTVYRVTFLWKKVKEAQLMSTMRRRKLFIFSKHWTPPLGLVDWLDQSETGP